MEQQIIDAYTTPGHPTAFSAPETVAKYFNISKKKARDILQQVESYSMHREYKQPRVYNPYYVHNRRQQVQADLIDVKKLCRVNQDVKFLLLLIDIFTKKIWVYALKNKSARVMARAFRHWLTRDVGRRPKILMTDRGLEFVNAPVQQLLRNSGVEWQPANGTLKAAIAERANKTFQILMYKYMTEHETTTYLPVLASLVRTYNKRPHRSLDGMTPNQADRPHNVPRVQAIFHERYAKLGAQRRLPRLKVGDAVRIKTQPKKMTPSSRAYAIQFQGEYFTIDGINRNMAVPMYYLRSQNTGNLIQGGFYIEELQPIKSDIFRIERVIRERRRRGRRELLVKWRYFDDQHNTWIPAENVQRVFHQQ